MFHLHAGYQPLRDHELLLSLKYLRQEVQDPRLGDLQPWYSFRLNLSLSLLKHPGVILRPLGLLAAMVAESAPSNLRGTVFGVFNLVAAGALLVASVLAGALWSAVGPAMTFIAGAFSVVALIGLLGKTRALLICSMGLWEVG